MESLTLNFYGTTPKNETNYVNMILGYSLLRIDQKYLGKKQVIEMAINYLPQQALDQKIKVEDLIFLRLGDFLME